MQHELLKNFDIFKNLLIKGQVFYYKYKFSKNDIGKSRPIIILNNFPPVSEETRVYYVVLMGDAEKAYNLRPDETDVIRNDILKYPSAFYLTQIQAGRAFTLHEDLINGTLRYENKLSDSNVNYLDECIDKFISDESKAKTIPPKMRRAIRKLSNGNQK